jgi:hypothetical protein
MQKRDTCAICGYMIYLNIGSYSRHLLCYAKQVETLTAELTATQEALRTLTAEVLSLPVSPREEGD